MFFKTLGQYQLSEYYCGKYRKTRSSVDGKKHFAHEQQLYNQRQVAEGWTPDVISRP